MLTRDHTPERIRNAVPQEIGTYMYFLRYRYSDGQYHEKKGEVILLR